MIKKSQTYTKYSTSKNNRLYRAENDRILGGVARGIGEYFEIDPTIIRILFIVFTIFGGSGIIIYFILWVIIPSESQANELTSQSIEKNINEIKTKARTFTQSASINDKKNRSPWAIFLIFLGVIFLSNSLGIFSIDFEMIFPLILIGLGVYLLFKK